MENDEIIEEDMLMFYQPIDKKKDVALSFVFDEVEERKVRGIILLQAVIRGRQSRRRNNKLFMVVVKEDDGDDSISSSIIESNNIRIQKLRNKQRFLQSKISSFSKHLTHLQQSPPKQTPKSSLDLSIKEASNELRRLKVINENTKAILIQGKSNEDLVSIRNIIHSQKLEIKSLLQEKKSIKKMLGVQKNAIAGLEPASVIQSRIDITKSKIAATTKAIRSYRTVAITQGTDPTRRVDDQLFALKQEQKKLKECLGNTKSNNKKSLEAVAKTISACKHKIQRMEAAVSNIQASTKHALNSTASQELCFSQQAKQRKRKLEEKDLQNEILAAYIEELSQKVQALSPSLKLPTGKKTTTLSLRKKAVDGSQTERGRKKVTTTTKVPKRPSSNYNQSRRRKQNFIKSCYSSAAADDNGRKKWKQEVLCKPFSAWKVIEKSDSGGGGGWYEIEHHGKKALQYWSVESEFAAPVPIESPRTTGCKILTAIKGGKQGQDGTYQDENGIQYQCHRDAELQWTVVRDI